MDTENSNFYIFVERCENVELSHLSSHSYKAREADVRKVICFQFYKTREICSLAERLLASEEGFFFVELVNNNQHYSPVLGAGLEVYSCGKR